MNKQKPRALQALIDWRNGKGISPAELARRVNVHRSTILRVEAGKQKPDDSLLGRLVTVTGLPPTVIRPYPEHLFARVPARRRRAA